MADFSLASFASFLTQLAVMDEAEKKGLEAGCKILETEAKRVLGTYDYGWPQLTPYTQSDRVSKGFPANEPLLRTGDLRGSIEHNVGVREARVGTNSQIGVWQELGTSRIPPRSFMKGAAIRKEGEIITAVVDSVYTHLALGKPKP